MSTLAIRNACLVFALFFCGTVQAQYLTIERRADPNGLCGSPGLAACETAPSCTDPESNILRDDKYTGKILCNLPGRSLDIDEPFECPSQFTSYKFGTLKPSDTFFTSTDLHFGKSTVSDEDHERHMTMMNNFAATGVHWPPGIGFPDESIHSPAAIITTGDNAHDGQVQELGAYRLLYEQGLINESSKVPVFVGLGNHDVGNDCEFNNCAKRMFDYATDHNACGASLDSGSDNYSWDWNGVHFVQLNKWAGDTELGSKTTDTHDSGLQWLKDDLSKNVGHSRRPVVFFQHFGLDTFSTNGGWWQESDRESFWAAIRNYNVIGMFTGHIHSTGIYDFSIADSGPETHIDDFVGGTGGEDPCLNASDTACGGRGHFFAVRTSKMFLDVASLEWRSTPGGASIDATPQFTNLAPPTWDSKHSDTIQGPAFAFGQKGCRKIINQRLIDVSSLAPATGSGPITVTNTSSLSIPGPLALGLSGMTGSTCNLPTDTRGCNYSDRDLPPDVTNKSFVDRCVDTAAAPSTAFLFASNGNPITLSSGGTLSFNPAFTSAPVALAAKLYRVSPWKGANPNLLDLVAPRGSVPPSGTITVYGPPSTAVTVTNQNSSTLQNWLTVLPAANQFDQFGIVVLNYSFNGTALSNTTDSFEQAMIRVSTSNDDDEVDIPVTLTLKGANTITLSATPESGALPGQQINFKAVATYTRVRQVDGPVAITGAVTLQEVMNQGTAQQTSIVLATRFLNPIVDDPDENPPPDDTVLFPAIRLPSGLHYLQAVYAGDSFYAPSTSVILPYAVGPLSFTVTANTPGLLVQVDSGLRSTPAQVSGNFKSAHAVTVPTPQYFAGGGFLTSPGTAPQTRYTFSGWSDGTSSNTRSITISSDKLTYTANFEAAHQLSLNATAGGTVAADPPISDGFYPAGSIVTLTAMAGPGFVFTGWTDNVVDQFQPSAAVRISGPLSVTGHFAIPTTTVADNVTATYNPEGQAVVLSATVTSNGVRLSEGVVKFLIATGGGFEQVVQGSLLNGRALVPIKLPPGLPAATYFFKAVFETPTPKLANSVDTSHALTIVAATPAITWPQPAAIISGTALSRSQLDAIASVPGQFVYTPGLGAVLPAGQQLISTTFKPTDSRNYKVVSASVPLTVIPIPLITFSPQNLSFNFQNLLSKSTPASIAIKNSGDAPLLIGNISLGGANPGDYTLVPTGGDCGTTLNPGDTCKINVSFIPSLLGPRPAVLTISDNDRGSPSTHVITLAGSGILNYAVYATNNGCGAVSLSDASLIDSFDSSQGDYASTKSLFGANVALNGNARLQGRAQVNGTIFVPTPSTGLCVSGSPGISVSGKATVTGGYSNLPLIVSFTTPDVVMADSSELNIDTDQVLTPGSYGDIAVTRRAKLALSPGTYNINSLSLRQQASVTVSPAGQVVIRVAGSGPREPLDLGGGSITGSLGASGSMLIIYGGIRDLEVTGTSDSYGLIYAPNANLKLSGNGAWFGALVAKTITDTNSSSIHYDRRLGQ